MTTTPVVAGPSPRQATTPSATKGTSQLFTYLGPVRGNGYVMQINPTTGGDHVCLNGTLLPWPPNTKLFVQNVDAGATPTSWGLTVGAHSTFAGSTPFSAILSRVRVDYSPGN